MGFSKISLLGLIGLMVWPLEGFKVDQSNFISFRELLSLESGTISLAYFTWYHYRLN